MHNLKKFNMNRKYRVRIRCLTFLVTLFWLPLHAQEAGKEFRPAGEPISYAEKDNRKKSPEPLEDQKDKLKKQRIITISDTNPSRSMRGKICALPCMKTGQNWMK